MHLHKKDFGISDSFNYLTWDKNTFLLPAVSNLFWTYIIHTLITYNSHTYMVEFWYLFTHLMDLICDPYCFLIGRVDWLSAVMGSWDHLLQTCLKRDWIWVRYHQLKNHDSELRALFFLFAYIFIILFVTNYQLLPNDVLMPMYYCELNK